MHAWNTFIYKGPTTDANVFVFSLSEFEKVTLHILLYVTLLNWKNPVMTLLLCLNK